ncbi:MAG: DUF2798 domain-containing protein [Nevskiales bacterium]
MLLSERQARIAFALFMAFMITMIMSFVITLFNLRAAWTLGHWLQAWALVFVIAFPLILVLAPIGQKLVGRFTQSV